MSDLPAVEELISGVGVGLTSLSTNRASLRERVEISLESFAKDIHERGEEQYLFVLEDTASGRIAGTCAIKAGIGLSDPFYSYRIGTVVHASKKLKVHKAIPALYLCNDYTGCTEIGSLFLAPDYRRGLNGKLLSKCRFLFLAQFPERFAEKVIAELRGISDRTGRSPFWESLGKHFFSMEFSEADHLVGIGNKSFIAELMPKHPIYVPFLSEEAQQAIGHVHELTRPARKILEREGFRHEGYIDIFDGGPTVECRLEEIHSVKDSITREVKITTRTAGEDVCLTSNTVLQAFRCCIAKLALDEHQIMSIDEATASMLKVTNGDSIRVVALETS